jgi:hypothetical protein
MGSFFLKKKRPGHEAELSPPSRAEFMNDWTCTTIPTYAFTLNTDTTLLVLRWALINIPITKQTAINLRGKKYSCIRLKTERINPEEETTTSYNYDLILLHALCREGSVIGRYAAKMSSALRCEVP